VVGAWRIVWLVTVPVWGEVSIILVGVEAARRAGERGCCVCTRFYWGEGSAGIWCVGWLVAKDWRGFLF